MTCPVRGVGGGGTPVPSEEYPSPSWGGGGEQAPQNWGMPPGWDWRTPLPVTGVLTRNDMEPDVGNGPGTRDLGIHWKRPWIRDFEGTGDQILAYPSPCVDRHTPLKTLPSDRQTYRHRKQVAHQSYK